MNVTENVRLKEFRSLKKKIQGSREYLIVGIDVAKGKHHPFLGTTLGKTLLKRLVFDNTNEGFRKLLVQVQANQATHGLENDQFVKLIASGRKSLAQQKSLFFLK
ncbi:MAG: hypothetical protein A2Y79_02835 [Deltaproteobacteria bacterium RBG_13_43_22]|nr:MAG: hypothetical protein A2Y79_02835 [Deltaproteobacteria bacterium RBG_13_43_22]